MEAVPDLGFGGDMRPTGDRVIAGARLLGVDEKGKRASLAEPGHVGDAEHGFGIGRPVDPVAREVPAIGRLAHALQNLLEVERALRTLGPNRGVRIGTRSPKRTTLVAPGGNVAGTRPLTNSFEDALTDCPLVP